MAMSATVVSEESKMAIRPVECARCSQSIARWDGEAIVVQRVRQDVYVVIPGSSARIKCYHYRRVGGAWQACGYVNHVVDGQAT